MHVADRAARNSRRVWIDNMNASSYAAAARKQGDARVVRCGASGRKAQQKRRRILKTGHGKPPRLASRPHRRLVKAPHIATSFGWRLAAWRFFDGLALDQQWVWPAVTLYSRSSFGAMCLASQSPEST